MSAVRALAAPAMAANVYVALGDSITFGETELLSQASSGDRGYVAGYANTLATRDGGVRPTVINLAIDVETASSCVAVLTGWVRRQRPVEPTGPKVRRVPA